MNVNLTDPSGREVRLPPGADVQVTMNQPGQLDKHIEQFAEAARKKIEISPDLKNEDPRRIIELFQPFTKRITGLSEAMYSCRYHQLQFIFRLDRVARQQLFEFKPPTSPHAIRINDRPLQSELESFLISTISSLDALSELVRVGIGGIGNKHDTFQRLAKHLRRYHPDAKRQAAKDILCPADESWAQRVRDIRNGIVHGASFSAFEGVGHKGMLLLDAKIDKTPAGEFAINTWRQLRELAFSAIEFLPPYRVGFDGSVRSVSGARSSLSLDRVATTS